MKLSRRKNEIDGVYTRLPSAETLAIKRELAGVPILILGLIILLGALFITGIIKFPFYQASAASSRISRIILPAPRGQILDRRGNLLAVNHSTYDCYFVTSSDVDTDVAKLEQLGEFLNLGDERREEITESRRTAGAERSLESELWAVGRGEFGARSMLVKRDLNHVDVTSLLERKFEFPGVFLERSYRRSFPAGEATAQVLGYLGQISESELSEFANLGYSSGDMIGKGGLERQYDYLLRGEPGERLVAVDAHGRIIGDAEMVPAVVPDGGAVIVHDENLEILKDGDKVEFRDNIFIRQEDNVTTAWENVYEETEVGVREHSIFTDRGSGGTYHNERTGTWHVFRRPGEAAVVEGQVMMRPAMIMPSGGSTLRLTLDLDMQAEIDRIMGDHVGGVVAMDPRTGAILAMVSEPGYDPNLFSPTGADKEGWQAINDDPNFPMLNRPVQNAFVPGSTFKIVTALAASENNLSGGSWDCKGSIEVGNRTFRCWNRSGHGHVNFTEAMAESCDVAFWEMAQELGHDKISEMAFRLGLGAKLGIDIPDERDGLIPDEEWKIGRFDERWFTGDTMNMSIGQGFVQITILQTARMSAVVANGGSLVTPHLNRLLTPQADTIPRLDAASSDINLVRRGLRRCITEGTGRGCNLAWIELAGKTGTADDPPRDEPHSWFISYGPYDDACLVIVVLCENGAHGEETAVPLSRRIWESVSVRAYLSEQGIDID